MPAPSDRTPRRAPAPGPDPDPVARTGASPPTGDLALRAHALQTLRLAGPVVVARIGILLIVAVDTAMTGHAGARELAFYSLAIAPQVPMILVGIGLLMGTVVLSAQADGAGNTRECGAVWRIGLLHAIGCGLLALLACQAGEWFLSATGQAPALAGGGGRVLVVLGWGLPALFLHTATTFFLEGISRPTPGMVVMLVANLLNAVLNWVFIYGNLGAQALGAEGAALATSLVRWFMFLSLSGYALLALDRERYGVTGRIADAWGIGRRLRQIGFPMALSHGLETSAFSAMILFAGLLGAVEVAAYHLSMNLTSLVFMVSIGIGTAASIRVANAVGRQDATGVRRAGWVAVALAVGILCVIGALIASVPGTLAGVYTTDPAVLAAAVPTLLVAALVLLPDGTQAVLMGALRGTGQVWTATALYLLSFWVVMTPLGYLLGVVLGGGAPALMSAVLVGCVAATLSLGRRFHVVASRKTGRT